MLGDIYRGDLLVAVLNISSEYCLGKAEENNRLVEIQITIGEVYQTLSEDILPKLANLDYMDEQR